MKKLIITTLLISGLASFCSAQNKPDGTKQHVMLQPDSNTVYYDEQHQKITGKAFSDKIGAGHYTFTPNVDNGKLVSMQLKKVDGAMQLGAPLPPFQFTALNGKTYSLNELRGKTLVLNFWFTACAPCRMEMPELNELVKKYAGDKDIVFIAVTYDEAGMVKAFLKNTPFNYNIITGQSKLITTYGIAGYPTNVVVGKDGRVAFLLTSYAPDNIKKLDAAIGAIHKL